MNRILPTIACVVGFAGLAHAQTVSQSTTTTDIYGNTVTTTITGSPSAVGAIANQDVYGYDYGAPTYNSIYAPTTNNYNYYGYGSSFAGYPGYGGVYSLPGYTVPIGQSYFGWDQPPTITALPQTIIVPPAYPLYGYSYAVPSCSTPAATGQITRGNDNASRRTNPPLGTIPVQFAPRLPVPEKPGNGRFQNR